MHVQAVEIDDAAALLDASEPALFVTCDDGFVLHWDDAASRLYGWDGREARGRSLRTLLRLPAALVHGIATEVAAGRTVAGVLRVVRRDGRPLEVLGCVTARVDAGGRRTMVALAIEAPPSTSRVPRPPPSGPVAERLRMRALEGAARAEAEEAAAGLGRLHRLAVALGDVRSPSEVGRIVGAEGRQATGAFGAMVLELPPEGEALVLLARDGYEGEPVPPDCRVPLAAPLPLAEAVLKGAPVWVRSEAEIADHYPGLRSTFTPRRSFAALPLVVEGTCVGALGLAFVEERGFRGEDESYLTALAGLAAQALQRARLYEAQEEARRAAEQARDRLAFLVDATRAISSSLDSSEIAQRICALAVPRLAAWASVFVADGRELVRIAAASADPRARAVLDGLVGRRVTLPAGGAVARVFLTGDPQFLRGEPADLLPDLLPDLPPGAAGAPGLARPDAGLPVSVAGVLPLRCRDAALGVLVLALATDRRSHHPDDTAVAAELAARVGVAMENAMLYEREHGVAETLQHAALPGALPDVPGVVLDARYLAGAGAGVGGDWYDAFVLRDGRVGLVVGDVVGHGVGAAAAMGQLRNALRVYALEGHGPAAVLARVNRLLLDPGDNPLATAVYAVLDPLSGSLRWARAGHPPPLVVADDVCHLDDGGSLILGVDERAVFSESEALLPPGGVVLLYSDGVVERRREDLAVGMSRLAQALHRTPRTAARVCDAAEEIVNRHDGREDDACLLAAARLPG